MLGHHALSEAPISALVESGGVPVLLQVEETDLAQAVGKLKTLGSAQAVETDVAQAMGILKSRVVGQVTETNLAQLMTLVQTWPLDLPTIRTVYAPRPLVTLTIGAGTVRYSTETLETP